MSFSNYCFLTCIQVSQEAGKVVWYSNFKRFSSLWSTQSKTLWSEFAQSCPTLCDPMDCSLPDSSIHGIFQVLEWVAISVSWDRTQVSLCRQMLYRLSHQGSPQCSQWSRNRCFLELSCFFHEPVDVGNLISGSSAFSKSSLNIWKFLFMYCWSLA